MWINRFKGLFLVVRLKKPGRRGFDIPVPFFVFEQTLDALGDLCWVADKLFLKYVKGVCAGLPEHKRRYKPLKNDVSFFATVSLLGDLFHELRKHGKWKLVEVEADELYLSVDFL